MKLENRHLDCELIHAQTRFLCKKMLLGVKYGKWEEDDMSRAFDSVRNGDMGVNEAARTYDVPRATLQRRLKGGLLTRINSMQLEFSTRTRQACQQSIRNLEKFLL
ncbi:uncharacterized protein LOC117283151 isoform X2 [Cryptotermes secundus]|uniref:uncharacterized protein LOC117283151 isoform X2 n=1 Tax=Cryptotermes secundus TaxID=105785 RepID=UPI001454C478|nr:uncharacterized protein LOC117283151 isoform X2 [Cryptotermes secundus]